MDSERQWDRREGKREHLVTAQLTSNTEITCHFPLTFRIYSVLMNINGAG